MSTNFTHYAASEGADLQPWTAGPIDGRSLRNRSAKHVKLNGVVVFALKAADGRMWNCVDGWREADPTQEHVINGDTEREPEDVIEEQKPDTAALAQAYAMRVWAGQSVDINRFDRIERVKRALEGQNLPTEGVQFPDEGSGAGDTWTDDDEQPVTWRKASA